MAQYIIIETQHTTGEVFRDFKKLKTNESVTVVETDNVSCVKEDYPEYEIRK
ncbi:DUF1381 domain-containing protein [Staphylococcus capitis]|uniref:DUF1381 domain-containing protein n=1 Tax=Staphylococcus capitis TaxID=29388 RepID=UPI002DB975A2|nr:hypothetical protein [Staphylococcus capitis]MEB5628448.1 hypothetical protein [Staphylococcus capitis]